LAYYRRKIPFWRCRHGISTPAPGLRARRHYSPNDQHPWEPLGQRAAQAEQGLSDLKAMLADMKADRDRWRDEAAAWREQAQASQKQLTDQREPQSWWRWLRSTG
jgi:hypothetical protein